MNAHDSLPGSSNVYYNTSIALCVFSYEDIDNIPGLVSNMSSGNSGLPDLAVVWGPAEHKSILDEPNALMYIAQNQQTNEYYVVIRGTNPESLSSWLDEDLDIDKTEPFSSLHDNPSASKNVLISKGTFTGTNYLLGLKDPTTDTKAFTYLQGLGSAMEYLYVTGHSLGGTLAPVMFAYLNSRLYGGVSVANMALWSFAGLTPGGSGFNGFLSGMLPDPSPAVLFQNTLDIAPFLWSSKSSVESIYSNNSLQPTDAEKLLLDELFHLAGKSGITYAQPSGGSPLTGVFDVSKNKWDSQVLQQHHSTTYQTLISAAYPLSNS